MKLKFAAGHTPCLTWQQRWCLNTCQGQERPWRPQWSAPRRPRGTVRALALLLGRPVRLYLCPGLYSHRKGSSGSRAQLCQDRENDLEKQCLQTTLLLWEAGCTAALSGFNTAVCSALPHAVGHDQPDWPFAPPRAGWSRCLSSAAVAVREPGLSGQGVSAVLESEQVAVKMQQSLAEGWGSCRETQTLVILNDKEVKRCRGVEKLSRRLVEGQGTRLQPLGLPMLRKGCHVER